MICIQVESENNADQKDYLHPLSSSTLLLKHFLCPKINFPSMARSGDEPPKIFRKPCCFNECQNCLNFMQSKESLLACPMLFSHERVYHWKEYGLVALDNGNSIKEIKQITGTVDQFRTHFLNCFRKYKEHYFKYKWLNLCRREDIRNLKKGEIFIQTDYSAQPTLDSQDKLNSVGHGVCVLSCWVVLHSPRQEYYVDENGEQVEYTFYECDHVRVVSPSSGKCKDQDWFLHCNTFDKLIDIYKAKIENLSKVIVWTDGAPNQYKCRQNFFWLSTVHKKHSINIVHRFGATAQFKGVHDKIGQVAKWTVK